MLRNTWVFSRRLDPLLFILPYFVGLGFILALDAGGKLQDPFYGWFYLIVYVLLDVPHVFATAFRTYLDDEYVSAHKRLLILSPLAILAVAATLFLSGNEALLFGGVIYINLTHICRQQYIYMGMATRDETDRADLFVDRLTMINVMAFPLLWWHTHQPRHFALQEGTFMLSLPPVVTDIYIWIFWTINGLYIARQVVLLMRRRPVNLAKHIVLLSTGASFYTAVIAFNSQMAFFAVAIFMHSGTYLFLVHQYGRHRWAGGSGKLAALFSGKGVLLYYGILVVVAYVGESLADAFFRHAHGDIFPLPHISENVALTIIAGSILLIPQLMHYIFDLFLWNRSDRLYRRLGYG